MNDLISKQAAIDAINRLDIPEDMCVFEILSHIELEIGTLPPAQPETHEERTETHACDLEAELVNAGDKTSKSYWALQAAYLPASVLPPAQPEQQWIPCSERPPEEKGEYLVAYHPCYWDDVEPEVKVGIDSFRGKTSWAKRKYQRVIAWMPLPAPYQGEGEE